MESSLYQTKSKFPFPYSQDYGLVCFLSGNRSIGEVTARHIEILNSHGKYAPTRIYNQNLEQPWISKTAQ
jgi:hypothetical protein